MLEKQNDKTSKSKVFIVIAWFLLDIAWILLVLNAIPAVRNLTYEQQRHPGLGIVEIAIGHLTQITMLVLGACVLSLTTWLCLKNRYGRTAIVAAIIIIILSIPLALSTIAPSGGIAERERLGNIPSYSSSDTTELLGKPVTGILYSEDKPTIVIGEQMLQEGDIIHGVKVIKIYEDKVEFEKDGKRWIQKVQETPPPE